MYFMLGMIVRPIFIDFVGLFIPFISHFWLIRGENDIECGALKVVELSLINYSFLVIANFGQISMIVLMIIKYRNQFEQ